jgi:hypothetical protein
VARGLSAQSLPCSRGFFIEWKRIDPKTKLPWVFAMKNDEPFALAGVWRRWRAGTERKDTFANALWSCSAPYFQLPLRSRITLPSDPRAVRSSTSIDDSFRKLLEQVLAKVAGQVAPDGVDVISVVLRVIQFKSRRKASRLC